MRRARQRARDRADECEDGRLGQQLRDDSRDANRRASSGLRSPAPASRHATEERRDVRAGDQQQHRHGAEEQPERCAAVADHGVLERCDLDAMPRSVPGILFRQLRLHATQVCLCLRERDTRSEPPDASKPGECSRLRPRARRRRRRSRCPRLWQETGNHGDMIPIVVMEAYGVLTTRPTISGSAPRLRQRRSLRIAVMGPLACAPIQEASPHRGRGRRTSKKPFVTNARRNRSGNSRLVSTTSST